MVSDCYCGRCHGSPNIYLFGGCIRDYILKVEPNDYDVGFFGDASRIFIRSIVQKFQQDSLLEFKSFFDIDDVKNEKYLCFPCEITLPKSKKRVKIDLVVRDEISLNLDFSVNSLQVEMCGLNRDSGNISIFSSRKFSIKEVIDHIEKKELHFMFSKNVCQLCDRGNHIDDNGNHYQKIKYSKEYLVSNGKFLERLNKMLSKGFIPRTMPCYTVEKFCEICKHKCPNVLQSSCHHTYCVGCITKYYEVEAQKKTIKNNELMISTSLDTLNKTIVERLKKGEDYATITSTYWDYEYAKIMDMCSKKQKNIAFYDVKCPCCSHLLTLYTKVFA
jgi:hypothetical protein